MAQKKMGLGKGLGALLSIYDNELEEEKMANGEVSSPVAVSSGVTEIPVEKIYPNPEAGRGVIYTTSLYEVVKTLSPAALLEVAFHDNEEYAKWIIDNIENIGRAIAVGIDNYFKN